VAVTDQIQPAPTGRSKCRGCGRGIAKGELRFGESLPNPYGEGEALHWFHVQCAACMRPQKFLATLDAASEPIDDAEVLRALARESTAHPRLERLASAERAPSGRAHCRLCRELIEKGHWRLNLQQFEEGRMGPSGSIHVECAEAYFGTADVLDRVARLTPALTAADKEDLAAALAVQRPHVESEAAAADEAPGAGQSGGDTGDGQADGESAPRRPHGP
jgi:hypothetical protein